MRLRLEDKKKAIELRIEGKTYKEIRTIIPNLSKSTLSGWLKGVKLTEEQKERLRNNIQKISYNARVKSAWTKKRDKQERKEKIIAEARKEYLTLSKNSFFLIGLVLYWTEGSRKTEIFQFTNSDPLAIKLMLRWIDKFLGISKEKTNFRIYIHKIYAHENCEQFWSQTTGIPASAFKKTVYKPTPHKIKRNLDYKGCVQIRIFNIKLFWKVMEWIQGLIKEYEF